MCLHRPRSRPRVAADSKQDGRAGLSARQTVEGHHLDRKIVSRTGIGATATIFQPRELTFHSVTTGSPVVIHVVAGTKYLRHDAGELCVRAGESVALSAGQVLDIKNEPQADSAYQALWVAFDPQLVNQFVSRTKSPATAFHHLGIVGEGFSQSFRNAGEVIAFPDLYPDAVARHRAEELLVWLDELGVHFSTCHGPSLAMRVREIISQNPGADWSSRVISGRLALSEATLRRKLAHENTSLRGILTDVRMTFAMQMLQSTDMPVSAIAGDLGYESQSRFAIRFRDRFGFAPRSVRGHRSSSLL